MCLESHRVVDHAGEEAEADRQRVDARRGALLPAEPRRHRQPGEASASVRLPIGISCQGLARSVNGCHDDEAKITCLSPRFPMSWVAPAAFLPAAR